MNEIAIVVEDFLHAEGLKYSVSETGRYIIDFPDAHVVIGIDENARFFSFFGYGGIKIPSYCRKECLRFLNECNLKYPLIFFLTDDNECWVRSSGYACGYELSIDKVKSYLVGVLKVVRSEQINKRLLEMANRDAFTNSLSSIKRWVSDLFE